ncbi:MAG: conjugative transposon protein TraM [Candidatus Cardinium sp.]|nr:conjugative transposon protein TraM [Candidatus Cardinium sp.]
MVKRKYLLLVVIGAIVTFGKIFVGKRKIETFNPVNVKVPDFQEVKKNDTKTLLDAYDEELSGKKESLLKKTSRKGLSSLAGLFNLKPLEKPKKPKKEKPMVAKLPKKTNIQTAPSQGFISYQDNPKEEILNTFYRAHLEENQKVTDESAVILKLEENGIIDETVLPAGTVLYGKAKFAKNRILVGIHVAQYLDKTFPISLSCYDTDFLPGLFCEGVNPIIENNSHKVLDMVTDQVDSGLASEVSKMATQFIKDITKTKSFKLHKGREVYVCAGKQLKNR